MTNHLKAQINELTTAYHQFMALTAQVPLEQQLAPGVSGHWSTKDVISHLIGWDSAFCDFITNPDEFIPEPLYDVHSFNDQSVADRKHQNWAETVEESHDALHRLVEALDSVHSDMRIFERTAGWLTGRIADYRFHTDQLEEWLGQQS
ncbi:MAG: maleylpyruvate isomerase N-terminal domain-containing protein [Chloroflexota bacterium]